MAAVSSGRSAMELQLETQNGAVDRLKRLYPTVDENKTPLPRAWSPKEKYNYIGLSQNNLRVHYKEQILKNEALTIPRSMDNYRDNIRQLLLTMSDDMKYMCLFCGCEFKRNNEQSIDQQRNLCKRYFHKSCTSLENNLCQLCNLYTTKNHLNM